MRHSISNSDDIIDSRDVISRIDELRPELDDLVEAVKEAYKEKTENEDDDVDKKEELEEALEDALTALSTWLGSGDNDELLEAVNDDDSLKEWAEDCDARQLFILEALAEEAEGYADDWKYGATLIRESYWVEYCEEFCKDIGDLPKDIPGYLEIDWDKTADNLRLDYTKVDFDGVTYLVR